MLLAVAALIWVGVHIGVAGGPSRGMLAERLGEGGYRAVFSVVSVLSITLLIVAYGGSPYLGVWRAPAGLRWLLLLAMLPTFVLFGAALLARNPTAIGGEAALGAGARGIVRVTRHPMLWSFAIWAAVHMLGNGDVASLVFFGAFLVTALLGMPSIDKKLEARDPAAWQSFAAETSIVPFGAILEGRNTLTVREIGWAPVAIGVVLWGVLIWAHPHLFGVRVVG